MTLDLATLLWILTIVSAVLAVAVLVVAWRDRAHAGLGIWGVGLVVNALSYPMFALRTVGWPHVSILIVNVLTALTIALHLRATIAYQGRRAWNIPPWVEWAAVASMALIATVFLHHDQWRNVLGSFCLAGLSFLFLLHAWLPGLRRKRLTGRLVLTAGTLLLVMMFTLRGLFMVLQADWQSNYRVPDQVQAWTYMVAMAVILLNTMGFVLMQMEQAVARQHDLATHDGLTGVYNRLELNDALERYGARSARDNTPLALLMIDIDHFKTVNDRYGHLAGDHVLREVAQRVGKRLRRADMLARFGGEEFLALLPGTNLQGAMVVAESVRCAIAEHPVAVLGHNIPVTVSVGVHVGIPGQAPYTTEAMIAASDRALYEAKAQGRNRVIAQ